MQTYKKIITIIPCKNGVIAFFFFHFFQRGKYIDLKATFSFVVHLLLQTILVKRSLLTMTGLHKHSAGTQVSISTSLHALSCFSSHHLSPCFAQDQQTLFSHKLSPHYFLRKRRKKNVLKSEGLEGQYNHFFSRALKLCIEGQLQAFSPQTKSSALLLSSL